MEASPVLVETPKPKCPWAAIPAPKEVTLDEVMSEELISVILKKEKNVEEKKTEPVYLDDISGCGEEVTDDCSDDHMLAQMLQLEYDKEYNSDLKKVESLYNGISKVRISYGKYFQQPRGEIISDDSEDGSNDEELEAGEKAHWALFDSAERSFQAVGRAGVSKQGNVTTTKHDPTICGRRNAGKVMEFFPCFNSGDGGKFDMRVSNRVYNSLRQFSVAENKRGKLHDKQDIATTQKTMDPKTQLILFKLLNNETMESMSGSISTGKEACVYHAWSGLPVEECPIREFAVKVFKTTLNEFRNRHVYIKNDRRFSDRFSKLNSHKAIYLWAEKEMRNLLRIKEANIPCPEVITLKKHVLVMSFIGNETEPAPKIKDVDLPFEDMTIMYEQVVEILKTLYNTCNLVHADLSEYNLLWYQDKVWVIDVSQAIETHEPDATKFLLRDCSNVVNFFTKRGVLQVPTAEELLSQITGKPL